MCIRDRLDSVGDYITALETMPPSFISALLVGYLVTIFWPDKELEKMYASELEQGEVLG